MLTVKTKDELTKVLNDNEFVVLKVSAEWCGPCKMMDTVISQIEPFDGITFVKVDADESEEDLIEELGIRNLPLFVYYKNGEISNRKVGAIPKQEFIETLQALKD